MSDQFVAEIRIFPFNFPPTGWAFCNGQLMPISQNTALFSLLGTTYGGDGKSTFALPDMQGNAPMQPGQGQGLSLRDLGEMSGVETITAPKVPPRTVSSAVVPAISRTLPPFRISPPTIPPMPITSPATVAKSSLTATLPRSAPLAAIVHRMLITRRVQPFWRTGRNHRERPGETR